MDYRESEYDMVNEWDLLYLSLTEWLREMNGVQTVNLNRCNEWLFYSEW